MIFARSAATGRAVEIEIQDGRLQRVAEMSGDAGGLWAAPGMIDLQVNGFAGVDYNDPASSLAEIARSIRAIRATGVTRFLPTVITGSHERMQGALPRLQGMMALIAEVYDAGTLAPGGFGSTIADAARRGTVMSGPADDFDAFEHAGWATTNAAAYQRRH